MATTPSATPEVREALQSTLVDLIDLSLVAKQAHWNLYGPHFRSVHLHLDDVVALARTGSDDVAERLVTVGHPADGRTEEVAKTSKVRGIDAGPLGDDKVIAYIAEELQQVSNRIREQLPDIESPDPLTHDLLVGIATEIEKEAWMFRAQQSDKK